MSPTKISRKKKRAKKPHKMVYFFGDGRAEGGARMRNLLGGKGANLAEMTNLKIPVPAGFTITTEACIDYYKSGGSFPPGLKEEVAGNLAKVEKAMGAGFGDPKNPLLVSVRSGARVSMPGMMDTVLNIGLNDRTVKGLIEKTRNPRAAYDSYRRFVQMYGNVVLGIDKEEFESILSARKKEKRIKEDTQLSVDDLKGLVARFKAVVRHKTSKDFPEEPSKQLWGAIGAVFGSWNTKRATSYRKIHSIPDDWGTAANVQSMVFGNMGPDSATGVAFTRNPSTGENLFYGEYLINAQGEDVVAGIRTPHSINKAQRGESELTSLEEEMPEIYQQLEDVRKALEDHYRDTQDIEFTVQEGKLWMLQTRVGKRTAQSAIRIAVEMAEEGLIDKETAVARVAPDQLDQLLHRVFDPKAKKEIVAKGLPASPGAATGKVVFSAEEAERWAEDDEKVILVRTETSPDDVHGMYVSQGVLTSRGGLTSHAAVVARGMGKCCVAGCEAIRINYAKEQFAVADKIVKKGDYISLDGGSGEVMIGQIPTIESEITQVIKGKFPAQESLLYEEYSKLMSWVDEIKRLGVRTNADTPSDAKMARDFGAEGIGLTRTEHMFFGEERLPLVRAMILAKDEAERVRAAEKLMPLQKEDFKGILKAMDGMPVIIRLLDPPLHEFLPRHEDLLVEVTTLKAIGGDKKKIAELEELMSKVAALHEFNPMLGHRGCRLGVTSPEIYRMQVRAIFEATVELVNEGLHPIPEVMIPLVSHVEELRVTKRDVQEVADEVIARAGIKLKYMVGTMIELPRAAVTADEIAKEAEFFSYGTNDLTQTVFGFSRDDIEGKFLPIYIDKNILENNPFAVLDRSGVGALIRIGIEKGRKTRPNLEVGICGEHGGEPSSVEFCHQVGMDYVSCSPYRVPIARLAAAHAVLNEATLDI